jgi:serine phosphatase RsbU (regulator of sigma subunit)
MEFAIPNLPYARVHARSVACKEVGGDFYDVIATADGLYVVIADISGKGVSAAILASTLQGLLYGLLLAGQPLAEIADVANRYICEKNVQKYATMIRRHLRICKLRARAANAGEQCGCEATRECQHGCGSDRRGYLPV